VPSHVDLGVLRKNEIGKRREISVIVPLEWVMVNAESSIPRGSKMRSFMTSPSRLPVIASTT